MRGATDLGPASAVATFLPWPLTAAQEYWIDAWQRSVLLLDVLRQRGNNQIEHNARAAPHVLTFAAELLLDGRTFDRPVNYGLVRIVPPDDVRIDPAKRPFIVFDPRAGHGPGIGGMKHDSEIGVALRAGHPCYFVGFLPTPVPGQTIEDVCRAEARFVAEVIARHPDAQGKPCLIGNCQAGWQIMMMSAIRPDLPGPIMLAGAPLSYWAGVRGKNPMRYLGGLLGGTWLTALAGDLGDGIFDGAHLVANFESMNPANTYWKKLYNVYSHIDTEPPRFLEFEKWWGSPVLLNAQEMQAIADDLFVGNKLTSGQIATSDGIRADLRNISSPIIVFCSWGDDITPPQQALGWITDLYEQDEEIIAAGQTIVYCLHQSIGHLGIFVSGKVATKEHGEFAQCMDMIDLLPPGLYEAKIEGVDERTVNPELVEGKYLLSIEPRTLNDIRALGVNSVEDDRRFATVARVSEVNLGLYQMFLAPMIRALNNEASAEWLRRTHPNRLRFEMFSDKSPLMSPVAALADAVQSDRRPASPDNPWLAMEHTASGWIQSTLALMGEARDTLVEATFLSVYGSPLLQTMVGLHTGLPTHRRTDRDIAREAAASRTRAELEKQIDQGGLVEAIVRALIYIRRPERRVDERMFAALKEIAAARPAGARVGFTRFKMIVREQFLILHEDEDRAISALPRLLPPDRVACAAALDAIRRILTASGPLPDECKPRLALVETLFADHVPARAANQQSAGE
jgi:hypothetical protein